MIVRRITHTFLCLALVTQAYAARPLVVGYYPSWNKASYPHTAILYENLTHIGHAFLIPNADGSLGGVGGFAYPELVQTAHAHGVKVVVSLGGWGQSDGFSPMAADTAARHRFVDNILNFCVTNGYDGADLDWEYPKTTADRSNMRLLVHELREAFNNVNTPLLLSMAGPSTDWSGRWFDLAGMKDDFNWIGIMTYDYYGSWTSVAGPNSPLFGTYPPNDQGWIDFSVDYYNITRGIPKQKLCIGVPFYGWSFKASSMYSVSTGASQMAYSSIAPAIQQGWSRSWDASGQVPYIVNSLKTQIISYDDSMSIAAKGRYVTSKGMAGAIVWAIGQDLLNGDQPLLRAIGAGLVVDVRPVADAEVPEAIHLFQNYPNPFNPETQIRFCMPAVSQRNGEVEMTGGGFVTLKVYDLLGREVRTLVEGKLAPGEYQVPFSSEGISNGIYIYRLTARGSSVAKPMVVLR